jgi:stearoyl-CoA desaturase (delta-9 desaturase)|tara:strand:- start:2961 stop:3596 length:636 start_codon:yes stop_codon:yes gene_type:complete
MSMMIILLGFLWYQFISVLGLSIGLHRYFAHKQFSYKYMSSFMETVTLFLSLLAGSRSPLGWIGAHRIHHRYSDTNKDPHSPLHKGFLKVLFNQWKVRNIPMRYVRDLYDNKRIMFFHNYWLFIWIIAGLVTLMVSWKFFFIFVVSPFVYGFLSFGIFNALGHSNGKPVTNSFINLLSGGEGPHDVHHKNSKQIKLSKYDISGIIIEKCLR